MLTVHVQNERCAGVGDYEWCLGRRYPVRFRHPDMEAELTHSALLCTQWLWCRRWYHCRWRKHPDLGVHGHTPVFCGWPRICQSGWRDYVYGGSCVHRRSTPADLTIHRLSGSSKVRARLMRRRHTNGHDENNDSSGQSDADTLTSALLLPVIESQSECTLAL